MKRDNWEVKDFGIRPAGPPDRCFYCDRKKGEQHKKDCVIRQRTVVIRTTFEYTISIPEDWLPDMFEAHRNEGTWCGTNGLHEIEELLERIDSVCLCPFIETEFVREADERDEERSKVFVKEIKG